MKLQLLGPSFSLVLLSVGLSACNSVVLSNSGVPLFRLPFGVTQIQVLQSEAGENWAGAVVRLKGTVGDRVPLIDQTVYQLQDSTGSIWVITDIATQPGDEIVLKGTVRYQPIRIAERELGEIYVEEQRRLETNGRSVE